MKVVFPGTYSPLAPLHFMSKPLDLEIELLRATYAAFNARDIDAAIGNMTADVAWPKAFKGGFVRGPQEIRAYWTEQWGEIDPHVEPVSFHPQDEGQILIDVHQVVRDLGGALLADEHTGHLFTFEEGLISKMEIRPLPVPVSG
jgi:hypothetical protein